MNLSRFRITETVACILDVYEVPARRQGAPRTARNAAMVLAIVLAICGSPAYAQISHASIAATDSLVEINFQDADLRVVISALADVAGVTVVHSGLPSRRVTLRTPVPVRRADARAMLESVARSNNLELLEENGLIRVVEATGTGTLGTGSSMAQSRPGMALDPRAQLFVHRLRHTKADLVAGTLREVFGLGVRTAGEGSPSERTPLSEELRRQRITMPGMVPPNDDNRAGITPLVPSGPGVQTGLHGTVQIVPDALTNSLLIRGSAIDYQTLVAAIDMLDVRPLQVVIEVLILEVRRDRRRDLGVSINAPAWTDPETGVSYGGEFLGTSAGDLTLRVLGLGGIRADVIVSALAAEANVNVLSRPVILAQNNQTARILVGSQRPFIQISRALPTDGAVRDQVVQYRDVGTQLTITPTINVDGYVSLAVLQEVSTATAETQFGAPVISTREAETKLFVKDRHTVIIGGLIEHQRESVRSGIPILKDIPLLGLLFRSSHTRRGATELFLLITPHVLRSDDDMDEATRTLGGRAPLLRKQLRGIQPPASDDENVPDGG